MDGRRSRCKAHLITAGIAVAAGVARALTATRPSPLVFNSLAELFEQYETLFLQGHDYRQHLTSRCGLRVTAFDRCFLHLVKLSRGGCVTFNIQEEKLRIRRELTGYGPYTIDEKRARLLPSVLDTLLKPHQVFELKHPQTADLGFLKHYGDPPYPFTLVLIGWSESDDCLIPVTGFPVKRNRAKSWLKRARRLIWQTGDAPIGEA